MQFKLLILAFLTTSIFQAQNKEEIRDFFWGKTDSYKTATTIPDKYKNESAKITELENQQNDYNKKMQKFIEDTYAKSEEALAARQQ